MPWSRHPFAFVPTLPTDDLTPASRTLVMALALAALWASAARAQGGTPLHLAANRFELVAGGDTLPVTKPLRVHNGGAVRFTDVRVTRVAYADSARGVAWLVALPRQVSVAPDELATIAALCVDPTGLPAGTYRATAGVTAREVPEPVAFTVTLVVTDAGAGARPAAARCGIPVTK